MNRTHVYETLFPAYQAALYADADQAVTKAGLWDWLAERSSKRDRGFVFADESNVDIIASHMKFYNEHSGASFGVTMRAMEFIARHGFETWVADVELRRKSG